MLVSSQNHIFAGEKFNKGKLLLLPMGTLQVVAASKASSSQCIIRSSNLKDNVYVVIPWKCDFGKKSGLFCPFWMVKEEPTAEDSCLQKRTIQVGSLMVPAYSNKKQIEKGTALFVGPAEETPSKKRKGSAKP